MTSIFFCDGSLSSKQFKSCFGICIFNNFISNAIKYSKEDVPLHLVISTERVGKLIRLEFSDNGIGIDLSKNQKRIFQPYQRFTSQAGGRRVRLSLVHQLVERNGGTVRVESKLGEGTTFTCMLKEYS